MRAELPEPVRQWRVPMELPVTKLAGAVVLVALGLFFADGDLVRPALASVVAAGLVGWALRDLVAPVRVAADADGVTVIQGYAGRRRLPWSTIEAITLESRARLGLQNRLLEIDAGESLHLFGRYDLGVEPDEVVEVLRSLRAQATSGWPSATDRD